MTTCIICRFPVPLDDAIAPTADGRCLCLGCFARETETALPMPKRLRQEIITIVAVEGIESEADR
jgi:hypothetical protein